MDSDAAFILGVYERMKEAGLVSNSSDFSVNVLGKGPSRLDSIAIGERAVSYELLDDLEMEMARANVNDRTAIENCKRELTTLLCHQKCRSAILAAVNSFRQQKSQEDIDELLDDEITDSELLSTLLSNAGLDRVA